MSIHLAVVALALFAVTFAARFPEIPGARSAAGTTPSFALSGVTGGTAARASTFFQPGTSQQTRESVAAMTSPKDVAGVRAAGGVSPVSSFSSGVAAAAATTGEQGAGVQPLADIVDPLKPFVMYTAQPGDSPAAIAERFGISVGTLLDNNPTVAGSVLLVGQEVVVPRRDAILYKVGFGDTVDSIVAQYDNISAATVIDYRPNGIGDPKKLESGSYLLLPGATKKPPAPPPPPEPVRPVAPSPRPPSTGGGGPAPLPGGSGIFSMPVGWYNAVTDPYGIDRGAGRIHEGIDLGMYGANGGPIYAACDGRVTTVEYLTYSYGYYVIVDCGGSFTTLYAHMSAITVSVGQQVVAGTQVGRSGSTGYSTGEHLHFEIRINGVPVNPRNYLPF